MMPFYNDLNTHDFALNSSNTVLMIGRLLKNLDHKVGLILPFFASIDNWIFPIDYTWQMHM